MTVRVTSTATPTPPPVERNVIYIPYVTHNAPSRTDELETAFLALIRNGLQSRQQMNCTESLMRGARLKADRMATLNLFGHVITGGLWPNEAARISGCNHPYPNGGNQIESICAGSDNPEVIYRALLNSPAHRAHIIGEGFFARQTSVGVGFAENVNSEYQFYWVFWSAECM